jgi:hypothetical protein
MRRGKLILMNGSNLIRIIIISAIYSLVFVPALQADDGYVVINPYSGTVTPKKNNNIQMISEEVYYDNNKEEFTAIFMLKNLTSATQIIDIAFPVNFDESMSEKKLADEQILSFLKKQYQFKTFLDGVLIDSILYKIDKEKANKLYNYAFVTKKVVFNPKSTRKLQHKYKQKITSSSFSNTGEDKFELIYVVETGRSWAGKIKQAYFKFTLPTYNINVQKNLLHYKTLTEKDGLVRIDISISPKPSNVISDKNLLTVEWLFKEFDPDFNILCIIDYTGTPSSYTAPSRTYKYVLQPLIEKNKLEDDAIYFYEHEFTKLAISYEEYLDFLCFWLIKEYNTLQKDDVISINKEKKIILSNLCWFYINLSYARKGYIFNSDIWKRLFGSFSWYKEVTRSPIFNEQEKRNIDHIAKIRNELESIKE